MSPNRQKRRDHYRLSPEETAERDWRAFRGESPNPWGKASSDGFATMQILTERRPSKLERRSRLQ